MGRTVKASPNAKSTVGKFLKWFATSLAVSPFAFSSSICLRAYFALYSEDPLWVKVIYPYIFHYLQFLGPEKANFI